LYSTYAPSRITSIPAIRLAFRRYCFSPLLFEF
jgi:hypothetical protein